MNQKLLNLLHRVIGSKGTKLKKNDEYMYWSPFISHHKPKLQVNVFTQKWHCWVSNEGGHTLFQLFKKLNATNDQFTELREIIGETTYSSVQVKDEQTKKVELPKEFLSLAYKHPSPVYGHAMFYLSNRGITYEDILKYNIGYCDEGLYTNRVIIPSYDDNGQLNFFVGRDIFESKMKYRNSPTTKDVIGFELFINWDEPIVLCEGPFDAIAIKRNAIPLFGKTIMRNLKKKIYENSVKKIYLALDEDAIIDSIKITEEFSKNEINVYLIKLLKKDPSEIGFKNFVYLINDTKKTTFSDLVKLKLNGKKRKYMEI
jgi:DNA primase|tara:strand:- start:8165 stop:9109 length:945 start_codon:yes stop_codon:yes gene_type:complete